MKRFVAIILYLGSVVVNAQNSQNLQTDFFSHLTSEAYILSEKGVLKGTERMNEFVSAFKEKNGNEISYTKDFSIEVNANLEYEIGNIQSDTMLYSIIAIKQKADNSESNIEFLIIYEQLEAENELNAIDQSRTNWMKFCNSHQVEKLVSQLYVKDAYYYNRGRLLKGTQALTSEYSYMNSTNYTLTLSPKHVTFVNDTIAYELGRCSGSYPLPYMLVWEKQVDGTWMILMDSNY